MSDNLGETSLVKEVGNVKSLWKDFDLGVPGSYSKDFDDFHTYTAADWSVTETDGGATQALTAGAHGRLLLTNTGTENDVISMQKVGAAWSAVTSRRMIYECRFQVSEATQVDWMMGLAVTDTSPLDAANSIAFVKDDEDTAIDLVVRSGSAEVGRVSGLAVFSAATDVSLGFVLIGTGQIDYYVNRGFIASLVVPLPTADLRSTMHLQAGDGNPRTMNVDYVYAAQERVI